MACGRIRRLISVGSILADIRIAVPCLPPRGGDVLGSAATVTAGGGFNILAAAARQGLPTLFAGRHGTGPHGARIRDELAREGIGIFLHASPEADSGFCVVLVEPDGERTFVSSPGVEATLGPRSLADLPLTVGDAVFVSGYDLCYPELGQAIAAWVGSLPPDVALVADPGPLATEIPGAVLHAVMPRASIWTMNRREAELLTGCNDPAAVRGRLRPGLSRGALLVVRDGASGAYLSTDACVAPMLVSSLAVVARDSTGAGDAHTGVLIAGLAQGLDPASAAARANAAAAISVTRPGSATAPVREELDRFLQGDGQNLDTIGCDSGRRQNRPGDSTRHQETGMPLPRRSLLTAGALLAAPSIARAQAAAPAFKGQSLVVASWQNYGADDPGTLKLFEQATGAAIKNVYFTSEDGLLEMLREGGIGKIDVVLPNLEYVQPAASQGLLQPIDISRIKAWSSLAPRLRDDKSIRLNGSVYAVPWVQGATSLAVNPDVHPTPTKWSVLWDPANKGKVAFFDDPTTAVMTAALYLGEDPQQPDLDKVRKALLDLKANVKLFWSSGDDWNKAYITGEITMGNLWSGLAGTLDANGHKVDYIFPEDGTVVWGDTWGIVKDTPHLDLAYAWVNFLTSKEYFAQWITRPGPNQELAVPANVAAIAALPKAAAAKLLAGPLERYKGKVALQTGVSPAALKKWTQLWEDVKAS